MRPSKQPTGSPARSWHDFDFDGLTLSWTSQTNVQRTIDFSHLAAVVRRYYRPEIVKDVAFEEGTLTTFEDCDIVPEDGVERLFFTGGKYLGIIFNFNTPEANHQIKYHHNGQGSVEF